MSDFFIYADASLTQFGRLIAPELSTATERHRVHFKVPDLQHTSDLFEELVRNHASGFVIGLSRGYPALGNLRFAQKAIGRGKKLLFHWPNEEAIEVVDQERLRSYWRLWYPFTAYDYLLSPFIERLRSGRNSPASSLQIFELRMEMSKLAKVRRQARPIPGKCERTGERSRFLGTGVYLRTDFWAQINSGGSYGHTCYVASGLARVTERLVCFVPHHYSLLEQLGIHQVVLPSMSGRDEATMVRASSYYLPILKTAIEALRPAYIYERLCLGNYCGTQLSQDLGIPYIVEYNGSEVTMKRSFEGTGYAYEDYYLQAEMAAFQQATLISVVSELIKTDLVNRGIPASKILVNPNGVDPEIYKPLPADTKNQLHKQLGWNGSHKVIGFTGTFGGWHGVDVLAKAIPEISKRAPEARFLLIGNGNFKHVVDDAVERHNLGQVVYSCGRVPQSEGARLLGACDIFLSPHDRDMGSSRFFGSPTKIFEYMAMSGGIVASDLEQIGEVLRPALKALDLNNDEMHISKERAILCTPGNVEEVVKAVEFLLHHPRIAHHLGDNARQAALENYTWDHHISRLSEAFDGQSGSSSRPEPQTAISSSGDPYKNESQQQWNNDPCGSHYVRDVEPHTLEWFEKAESYRYREYAPWMPEVMEFAKHRGKRVLEIGAGMGTDLAQFARGGAVVTDADLSLGHIALAKENFRLRGLEGCFTHTDAEYLPFSDSSFDLVYTNGVIHHSPDTRRIISEIYRVLRPGGRIIVMVYSEASWHYWYELVFMLGLSGGLLRKMSMGEIMSHFVELGETGARPLVKTYTKRRLWEMFREFTQIDIIQRQLLRAELPSILQRFAPIQTMGKVMGWNLILKANKPLRA